jgi:hypothetical protein
MFKPKPPGIESGRNVVRVNDDGVNPALADDSASRAEKVVVDDRSQGTNR